MTWSVTAGLGRTNVDVNVSATARTNVTVEDGGATIPSVPTVSRNVTRGGVLELATLVASVAQRIVRVTDPQRALELGIDLDLDLGAPSPPPTVRVRKNCSAGFHSFFVYTETTGGALPQVTQIKLNVSAAAEEQAPQTARGDSVPVPPNASFTFVDMEGAYNGNVSAMFAAGTYLSPRPQTCSARIGTDGWSAWTFTYGQGTAAPTPDFALVPAANESGQGAVVLPSGAEFRVPLPAGPRNIAFASQWDNYPRVINAGVPRDAAAQASAVWVLVAGSTNPMQTLLPNAQLRFRYDDNTTEQLDLTPPTNFWGLCPYGGADYDYSKDSFCLPEQPPVTVQLGNNHRAVAYAWALKQGAVLRAVELEVLSLEVVIGILAVSLA